MTKNIIYHSLPELVRLGVIANVNWNWGQLGRQGREDIPVDSRTTVMEA